MGTQWRAGNSYRPLRGLTRIAFFFLLARDSVHCRQFHVNSAVARPRGGGLLFFRSGFRSNRQKKEEDVEFEKLLHRSRSSIESCYKAALFSAGVDVVTHWISGGRTSRFDRLLELLTVLWKVGFAAGLYQMSAMVFQTFSEEVTLKNLNLLIDSLYKIMAGLWRRTAWIIMLHCTVDMYRLFRDRIPWIHQAYIAFIVTASVVFRAISAQETAVFSAKNGEDSDQVVKMRISLRNMALCAAALLIRATTIPFIALSNDKKPAKVLGFLDLPQPIITAGLLWKLRHAQIDGYVAAVTNEMNPEIRSHLFQAQMSFYSKVACTLTTEATVKGLAVAVPAVLKVVKSLRQPLPME